jgi:hypothetical protein
MVKLDSLPLLFTFNVTIYVYITPYNFISFSYVIKNFHAV